VTTVQTNHRSPIWIIIHHMNLLRTSLHRTTSQAKVLTYNFFYNNLLAFNKNFDQNYPPLFFKLRSDMDYYDYTFVLVLTTLKIATHVAETCRCSLYNKIKFINLSA